MNITIDITDEELAIITKFVPEARFDAEVTWYVKGLVNFYISKGNEVILSEQDSLNQTRYQTFLANADLVAAVDAVIAEKKVVDAAIVSEKVEV